MNLEPLYGKAVQVHCFDGWQRNAVGILGPSELGKDVCRLTPMEKDDPLLKTMPSGCVANPLNLPTYIITGIFELIQTSGT